MAKWEAQMELNYNEMLLQATESLFSDKIAVVKNLLKSNRELFAQEVLDRSLLSCCKNGILLLMPAMISAGANLEVTDENGNTPLLVCALNSHEHCAKCLIMAGANVNAVNLESNTPLIASMLNSTVFGVTKHLVSSTQIKIDHANKKGHTALFYAIETANLNAIKLLIDAGASTQINAISQELCLNLEDLASRKGLLDLVHLIQLEKVTGQSLLLHAVLDRDLELAKIITSMDASVVNTTNESQASIMIQLLRSIQDNNNVINQADKEMFEFILPHVAANSQSLIEKEMIMDIAIAIDDWGIIERLSMFDFVISYQSLISATSKPDYLRLLLTKRHAINKLDRYNQPVYGGSPLHQAMLEWEMESAKALIQHGAFIDIDYAMEDAVECNNEKALQLIISEFPGQVEQKLTSPKLLHYAVECSAIYIIPVLLDHGANINSEHDSLYCLIEVEDVDVFELLLSRGADPNLKMGANPYTYPLHTFLSRGFKYKLRNLSRFFQLPRHDEVIDFVQSLLENGAQVNLKDDKGRTALHIATYQPHSVEVVKLLIDYGADINETDDDGKSSMWNAVTYEQNEHVQCLIDAGADINLVWKATGKTVLFDARNETILKILLDNNADTKARDGDSPLNSLLAKHRIGTESVKRLIDAGCDVNHENNNGSTVLIHAAKYVDIKLLELLIQEGADVNASERKFPFLTAVTAMLSKLWDNPERAISCINYLLDHNADIDKVNSGVIHVFITSGCLSLIPKFISSGLVPTNLSVEESPNSWFTSKTTISPLMMALLLNQSDLAQFFINIKYLLKSDIDVLYGNGDFEIVLKEKSLFNSLDLLKTVGQQPLPLETLCFVAISDTLGQTCDRRSKVQKLGLPRPMQDLLLFKNVTENDFSNMGTQNLYLMKKSLKQLNINDLDHYEDNEENGDVDLDDE